MRSKRRYPRCVEDYLHAHMRTWDRDLQALEEELSEILGTTVKLKTVRGGRGKLTIDYANLDQLDNVLQKLRR